MLDAHFAPGSGITLLLKSSSGSKIGADSIGERGKPAETVGEEAATELLSEVQTLAPVDRLLGDILIPYMAVATGRSEVFVSEITKHMLTNKVSEMITDVKFGVQGEQNKSGKVSVEGIGLRS